MKANTGRLRELRDTSKQSSVCMTGVPEGVGKGVRN